MANSYRQLLHYRLIEEIGKAGMGVVWKAVDSACIGPERLATVEYGPVKQLRPSAGLGRPIVRANRAGVEHCRAERAASYTGSG